MDKKYETIKSAVNIPLYRIPVLLFLLLCLPILTFSQRNIIHLGIAGHDKDSAQYTPLKIIDAELQETSKEGRDTIVQGELPGFGDYLFFYLFTPRYYLHVYRDFTIFKRRQKKLD